MYIKECRKPSLINEIADGIYTSNTDISLSEYVKAREVFCTIHHKAM